MNFVSKNLLICLIIDLYKNWLSGQSYECLMVYIYHYMVQYVYEELNLFLCLSVRYGTVFVRRSFNLFYAIISWFLTRLVWSNCSLLIASRRIRRKYSLDWIFIEILTKSLRSINKIFSWVDSMFSNLDLSFNLVEKCITLLFSINTALTCY